MELVNKINQFEVNPTLESAKQIESEIFRELVNLYSKENSEIQNKNINLFERIFYRSNARKNKFENAVNHYLNFKDNEMERTKLSQETKEFCLISRKIHTSIEELPGDYFISIESEKKDSKFNGAFKTEFLRLVQKNDIRFEYLDDLKINTAKFYWALGNAALKNEYKEAFKS